MARMSATTFQDIKQNLLELYLKDQRWSLENELIPA
jgi:hypothetical protein